MVDLTRASLLEQAASHFNAQGWPVTDLARFRMADDTDDGDEGDDAGNGDGDQSQLSAQQIADMQKALKKANKEAETHRLRLKEIEDRDKSEAEKLTERTRELESNLTTAQATALRYEIALDKGIPKSIASRLQGATREEMEADADELLKTIGATGKKPPSFDGGAKDKDAPGSGSFLTQAIRDRRSS